MDNEKERLTREVATPEELEKADTVRLDPMPAVATDRRSVIEQLLKEGAEENQWLQERFG